MKNNNTSIVAGIDFSAATPMVVAHSLKLAAQLSVPCVFLHVVQEDFLTRYQSQGKDLCEKLQQQAEAKIKELIPANHQQTEVVMKVVIGKPASELVRAVTNYNALMLVIAANDLSKKHLGSVASRCVRTATCDVMVLRDWQGNTFKRILTCVDYSPTSAKALARAATLAKLHNSHLDIVHVMFPPQEDYWGKVQIDDDLTTENYVDQCRLNAQKQMSQFIAKCAVPLDTIEHSARILESRFPSLVITSEAIECGADLVAMGTHGMSGFASHFIGSNAERLVNESPVSVLAVRD